jgi:Tol biopolymer transport system component
MTRLRVVSGDRDPTTSGRSTLGISAAFAVAVGIAWLGLAGCGGQTVTATGATAPAENGLIAFAGDRGSGAEIYTIGSDGSGLRRLTHLNGDASTPDWSPDGTQLAFAVEDKTLYLMDVDGSDLHRVIPHGGTAAFTPDGKQLVYSCCAGDRKNDGIFVMRADGSDAPGLRLSRNPRPARDDFNPEVSPDGQTVTFVRATGGELAALFAVNIDGSDVRRLTSYALQVGSKHDWAPDGRRIVITTHADHSAGKSPNVATIRSDGSQLRMLTHHTGPDNGALAGSYSPDGRWIVFRTGNLNRDDSRLYKMRPDGSHRQLIKRLPFQPRFSDWGPRP